MYCPRCNLHSEEYVDRCPLCDGPMEIDEVGSGVMKTPTIPDKDESTEDLPKEETIPTEKVTQDTSPEKTVTLELDQEQIAAEAEKERQRIEKAQKKEVTPAPQPTQEEEAYSGQEERLYQGDSTSKSEVFGRKKLPLFIGGGVLLILILGIGGYFFLSPSEKPAKPAKMKVAMAKKKARRSKLKALNKKPVVNKEKAAEKAKLLESEATKATPPTQKPKSTLEAKKRETLVAKKVETPEQKKEVKEPIEKERVSETETASAKIEPKKTELVAAAAPSSKPSIPKVVTLPNKPPVEALKPSPSLLLPPPDPQGKYSVHVGSFKIKDNALILVKKLTSSEQIILEEI